MPEIRNVNVNQADERCPACGQGFMRPTGEVATTNPPQYKHSCNAGCGHTQNYSIRYPYTVT